MSKNQDQLNEIVRLKKQIAESEFRVAQRDLDSHDAEVRSIQKLILSASEVGKNVSGTELNSASKYVSLQSGKMQELSKQRGILVRNIERARAKLQSAIVSETVLENE